MKAKFDDRKGWIHAEEGITEGITESKMGLTQKQAKFLAVIKDFIASNGYSPSYEELKQMNGMKSKSNVHAYVYALKKRRYLDIIRHSKRSIVVL